MLPTTSRTAGSIAAIAVALALGGCTSAEPISEPPISASIHPEHIINGDRAIVELAQDLTATFGPLEFSSIRPNDPYPEHRQGLALDVMIPGWDTPAGQQLGDQIASWVSEHAQDYRVRYLIWRQHYRPFPVDRYHSAPMQDRGSPTQNHLDHLDITVHPAGDGHV